MDDRLAFSVEVGDISTFDADVIALKYARNFHGADSAISKRLSERGVEPDSLRALVNDFRFVPTNGATQARYVLFIGTPRLAVLV